MSTEIEQNLPVDGTIKIKTKKKKKTVRRKRKSMYKFFS